MRRSMSIDTGVNRQETRWASGLFPLALASLAWLSVSPPARAADPNAGLQISVAGDLVGQVGLGANSGVLDRLDPRELEVLFEAPIDHLFDGRASVAAHREDGRILVELHELYVGSTKLIPRSRFRLGQFFLGVGKLNQVHRHDWPFISAPRVHERFFDSEAAYDVGLEYSYLFPLPFYLDLTLGLTNGWTFGHAHGIGTKPVTPTHYARLLTYADVMWGGGLQVGLNYLGRKDSGGTRVTLLGLDATAKWRENRRLTFLFQSEAWYQIEASGSGTVDKTLGAYLYPQYGLSEAFYLGCRFDFFTVTTATSNLVFALVPTFSWKPSEFVTIRLAYNLESTRNATGSTTRHYAQLQTVFILGAHPAHDF